MCHSRGGGNPEDGWAGGLPEPYQQKALDTPLEKDILIEDIVVDNPQEGSTNVGTTGVPGCEAGNFQN